MSPRICSKGERVGPLVLPCMRRRGPPQEGRHQDPPLRASWASCSRTPRVAGSGSSWPISWRFQKKPSPSLVHTFDGDRDPHDIHAHGARSTSNRRDAVGPMKPLHLAAITLLASCGARTGLELAAGSSDADAPVEPDASDAHIEADASDAASEADASDARGEEAAPDAGFHAPPPLCSAVDAGG